MARAVLLLVFAALASLGAALGDGCWLDCDQADADGAAAICASEGGALCSPYEMLADEATRSTSECATFDYAWTDDDSFTWSSESLSWSCGAGERLACVSNGHPASTDCACYDESTQLDVRCCNCDGNNDDCMSWLSAHERCHDAHATGDDVSCCVGSDIRATCQCAADYEWWDDRRLSAVDEPRRLGHCCDYGAYCSCMESELGAGCTAPDCGGDDWDEDDEECDIETFSDLKSSPGGTTNHGAGDGWCYSDLDEFVGCAASPGDCWAMCLGYYGDGLVAIDWWSDEGGQCYCQHECECMEDVGAGAGYTVTRDSRVGALPHECGLDEDEGDDEDDEDEDEDYGAFVSPYQGNSDGDSVVAHTFDAPIMAKFVQFWPLTKFGDAACLRVELYTVAGAVGIEGGAHTLSATSIYGDCCPANSGRLNYQGGEAWCASNDAALGSYYLQVELDAAMEITGVATQANGVCCEEGTATYGLLFSTDGSTWAEPSGSALGGSEDDMMFSYFPGPATHASARAACQALGGDLASIHSAEENAAAFALTGGKSTRIGLTDAAAEGTFVWDDGTPLDYEAWNWNSGEPNSYGGDEDCVGYLQGEGDRWHDIRCDITSDRTDLGYICRSPSPVGTTTASDDDGSSGGNGGANAASAGIIGGAVAGVAVLAAIGVGAFLYMRSKASGADSPPLAEVQLVGSADESALPKAVASAPPLMPPPPPTGRNFCSACGAPIQGSFCAQCGARA